MDNVEENTIVVYFSIFKKKEEIRWILGYLCGRKRTCFGNRHHLNVNKENVSFIEFLIDFSLIFI